MRFDIITIFPKIFDSYLNESILKRALTKKLIDIKIHNLRDFTSNKHNKVDDRPFGGGPGMVIKIEPLIKAISSILKNKSGRSNKIKVILFSATGKQFNNEMAARLAKKFKNLILVCGRYEGVDERFKKIVKDMGLKIEEISTGPYVLTGGELPAMILIDAVSRQIKDVLGKHESLEEKRLGIGVPVYTRPETFIFRKKKYSTPKVLLSGNHQKIEEWRRKHQHKYKL